MTVLIPWACPRCGARSAVLDTRASTRFHFEATPGHGAGELGGIRRRRACPDCGHRWTTYELCEEHAAALGPGPTGDPVTLQIVTTFSIDAGLVARWLEEMKGDHHE